jgi:signal transduction histidine kinase/ActR/RegA family two-component response regulator
MGDTTAFRGTTSWRTLTLIAMGLAGAATLIALVLILGGANRQRDRALELQAHSFDVMILARSLSGTIAQSEASLGRYVISGDRKLGQLYFAQWRLAGTQIDRLDRITDDNPEQQPRIDALRTAYQERGRELSRMALSTDDGRNQQALARYYQARKAPALTRIDTLLNQIIDRERALLEQRTAQAMQGVHRSSRIAGALAVFGTLLVLGAIALGWLTLRAIGQRAAARADAAHQRARADELTAAVDHATGELRLQEAKLRQIQKMEAVGQLTGGIAHDFNNMLAVVLGGIELARRHMTGDRATVMRHLDSAKEGADRAAALTRRLLAFSREESLKAESMVAAELVGGMSDLLDRTLGDAIELVAHDDGSGWRVRADRVQMENAILNLAVNARDAMNGRGVLTITTGRRALAAEEVNHCPAGDYVTLAVSDTGHGMRAEIAERVFEPFFTTKEAGKGTGLGLSQIFALVRQLEGEIAIDSAPGKGTTVTLYLPRDIGSDAAATPADIAAVSSDVAATLRVLVVEDDPRVLTATTGALEELGHRATGCGDPLDAPALLDEHGAPDLIISDVLMPRQTGPEMIAALPPRYAQVPVLFVTGYAGDVNAAEFGRHELLRKPFTLAGLERAIGLALSSAGRVAAE